jgi:nucleoside-diphosphate-sugar epimerase
MVRLCLFPGYHWPFKTPDDYKSENERPLPIEFYGESKFIAEQIVQEYGATVPFTIIRPSSVYGPRDMDFLNIFKQFNKRFNIYAGDRSKSISIIYVDDLVKGIVQAEKSGNAEAQNYHSCEDEPVTWQTIQEGIVSEQQKTVITLTIPEIDLNMNGKVGDLYSKLTG